MTDQSAIAVLHGVWAAYGYSFAANHDHENYMHTIGMGEVEVVLNGVNFRTRHNDYKLSMPSTTSTDYMAVEDIPFPPVPPEVLAHYHTTINQHQVIIAPLEAP